MCIFSCHCSLSLFFTLSSCYSGNIDKVDELMMDITEQQEVAQEISDAISRPAGFGEDYDEVRLGESHFGNSRVHTNL